jgi:hypothetical protein
MTILAQLLSDKKNDNMFGISKSTFNDLKSAFYSKNKDKIKSFFEESVDMVSNKDLRILTALIDNPQHMKSITMFIDGHDGRISYNNILEIITKKLKIKNQKSRKLKGPGYVNQWVVDNMDNILYLTEAIKAGLSHDANEIKKIKFEKFIDVLDRIALDGIYREGILNAIIEKLNEKGIMVNSRTFTIPLRKFNDVDFDIDELTFNNLFGGKRSQIESLFAYFQNVFERFHPKNKVKTSNLELINLELTLAAALWNINNFVNKHILLLHDISYDIWKTDNFEFANHELFLNNIPRVNERLQLDKEHVEDMMDYIKNQNFDETSDEDDFSNDEIINSNNENSNDQVINSDNENAIDEVNNSNDENLNDKNSNDQVINSSNESSSDENSTGQVINSGDEIKKKKKTIISKKEKLINFYVQNVI